MVRLQNYWLPGKLDREIERFVQYYTYDRLHESLENLTLAGVYFARVRDTRTARERLVTTGGWRLLPRLSGG